MNETARYAVNEREVLGMGTLKATRATSPTPSMTCVTLLWMTALWLITIMFVRLVFLFWGACGVCVCVCGGGGGMGGRTDITVVMVMTGLLFFHGAL